MNNGNTTTFNYKYNDQRKLLERNFKSDDGETGSEKYFYDKKGDLQKAIWKNYDGWLTGKIKFEKSRNGQLKKGTFKGKSMDAILYFNYDIAGNLAEIKWNFNDGKTQTYQFEYLDLIQ